MRYQFSGFVAAGVVAALVGGLTAVGVAGQTPMASPTPSADVPRTPDGKPDLNGVWEYSTTTPLERPASFEGREMLTDEEVEELNRDAAEANDRDPRAGDPG